ncbi:CLASP N-terminal domain [Phytophthora cinnamomi]|uniref:CLASP N-terminal domain n=1 Tax=Phytophthora cinnamomi TaxID=4785 RepID=UPI00355A6C29|nr:CLASP N-terminal domain [Phytophthora cinnamomi]
MERLARQVQETQRLLADPETDWKDCSAAIEELATAVESLRRAESYKDAVRLLLSVSLGIGAQLASIRSKLVKDVCEHLLRIVKVTGRDFQELANVLMPQIVSTAKSSSAAIRQPGAKLLCKLSETVRYDVGMMRKIFLQFPQDKVRVLLLEQLRVILVYWSDDELAPWNADMLEMVRRGLEDQNTGVRTAAREVLTRVSSRWRERVDEMVDMPSNQSKLLIISEHRDSPLAEAILEKYPELANKTELLSRGSFMKSRSSFHKSPRHKKSEQNIEIHVSATPPPEQRNRQDATMQESTSSDMDKSTTKSASASISSRREKSSTSRRLFDDTNIFDDPDDGEQENIPEVFDGSQMHGYRSKSVKQDTQELSHTVSAQIFTGGTASRATMARTSSASSVEEVLRYPGVTKLKESKIPSPSNRSPSFLNKKRLESPTRSSSSPELRPSLLPRPGSFTLKSQGSSGRSTPVAAAGVEEDKIETKPLSASDEYFSKPIPSSMATPIPPPPPTDNVTLRPRRRAFFSQEQEDTQFSPVLPSFEVPAPEEATQALQVEATPEEATQALQVETAPEGSSCSSSLDEETTLPPRQKQYADYTSDDVDDLSHLTEGSDQVESDGEWNRHQVDESESRSENGDESVHQNVDQSDYSDDDNAFPDEWRLDEGPRHKFDFEDEIGNRLSDEETKTASDAENERTHQDDHQGSRMERKQDVESSLKDDFSMLGNFKEEAQEETKPDALEGLLGVRDEMTRLRAITRQEEKSYDLSVSERFTPTSRAFGSGDTEQAQQQLPVRDDADQWDEPNGTEPSYLARLKHADYFARSPLLAPPADAAREQSEESVFRDLLSPLQTFEQRQPEATTFDVDHESSSEHGYLDLQTHSPSPARVPEQVSTQADIEKHNGTIDFVKEFQPAEIRSPRPESDMSAPQNIAQPEEPSLSHEDLEHAGRFHAAEKLFAARETPPSYGYYDRPQSPEPELYMHSETYRERLPPTQMGAILNPAMSPTPNVVAEDQSEDTNVAEEESEETLSSKPQDSTGTPQPDLKQTQPQASIDEREPTPPVDEKTPELSPNRESVARPVLTQQTAVPEMSAVPATRGWARCIGIWIVMFIAVIFCAAGILHAAKTVRESHDYHQALKTRIDMFEASIAESHEKVLKLEEDYAIWSEYVRKLTEEDEANALRQLEAIQIEVQKWQQDMKADLVQFRQALSVDSIEAAFADLRANNTKQIEQ